MIVISYFIARPGILNEKYHIDTMIPNDVIIG